MAKQQRRPCSPWRTWWADHDPASPNPTLPLPICLPCPGVSTLQNNDLQMIVRAHECVMDGFERFAQGHLITLFRCSPCPPACRPAGLPACSWLSGLPPRLHVQGLALGSKVWAASPLPRWDLLACPGPLFHPTPPPIDRCPPRPPFPPAPPTPCLL
jgi:hypothetical protein